jgi:hypothetical protein
MSFSIGVYVPVVPKLPVASPANADPAQTRAATALHAATADRHFTTTMPFYWHRIRQF